MLKVEVIPVTVPLDESKDRENMLHVIWLVFGFVAESSVIVPILVSDLI